MDRQLKGKRELFNRLLKHHNGSHAEKKDVWMIVILASVLTVLGCFQFKICGHQGANCPSGVALSLYGMFVRKCCQPFVQHIFHIYVTNEMFITNYKVETFHDFCCFPKSMSNQWRITVFHWIQSWCHQNASWPQSKYSSEWWPVL